MTEHATQIKRLQRSRSDRYVAGVCGGLADYFDLHPAFFRVGFVVLTLLGGSGILAYLAAVLVIPDEGQTESIASDALRNHRDRPWAAIALGVVAIAGLALLSHATFWPSGDLAWVLLLIAGLIVLRSQRRRSRREAAAAAGEPIQPRPHRLPVGAIALGLLVAGAGVLAALDASGVHVRWDIAAAVGAVLLGLSTAAAAVLRLPAGGVLTLALLLGAGAVAASTIDIHLESGIGDRRYHPASIDELKRNYELGIGDLKVDLRDIRPPAGETKVEATVGIGHLVIVIPSDVSVRVDGDVPVGDSQVLGENREDAVSLVPGSAGTLVVKADVGMGQLDVERAAVR